MSMAVPLVSCHGLQDFVGQFNMSFDDIKDLSVAALIGKMLTISDSDETTSELQRMLSAVKDMGIGDKKVKALNISGQTLTLGGGKDT